MNKHQLSLKIFEQNRLKAINLLKKNRKINCRCIECREQEEFIKRYWHITEEQLK